MLKCRNLFTNPGSLLGLTPWTINPRFRDSQFSNMLTSVFPLPCFHPYLPSNVLPKGSQVKRPLVPVTLTFIHNIFFSASFPSKNKLAPLVISKAREIFPLNFALDRVFFTVSFPISDFCFSVEASGWNSGRRNPTERSTEPLTISQRDGYPGGTRTRETYGFVPVVLAFHFRFFGVFPLNPSPCPHLCIYVCSFTSCRHRTDSVVFFSFFLTLFSCCFPSIGKRLVTLRRHF